MPSIPANPWAALPQRDPFVHPDDREVVLGARAREFGADHTLHLDLLPEPFLGDPRSTVVLLSRNPGFHPDDALAHGRADFADACRRNLSHGESEYPFYLLDPAFQGTPGGQYWRQKLGYVAGRIRRAIPGMDLEAAWRAVSRSVLCVEYHGYHSPLYRPLEATLPTQRYGFALVRAAVLRGAIVVALRSVRDWMDAVPELRGYDKLFRTRSPQNVTVTPRNCPEAWCAIIEAILAREGVEFVRGDEDLVELRPVLARNDVAGVRQGDDQLDELFRDPQTTVELLDLLGERFGFGNEQFRSLHHFGPKASLKSHRAYCEVDAPRFRANGSNVTVARRLARVLELRDAGQGWAEALAAAQREHQFPPRKRRSG